MSTVPVSQVGSVFAVAAPMIDANMSVPAALLAAASLCAVSTPAWVSTTVARLGSDDSLFEALAAADVPVLVAARLSYAAAAGTLPVTAAELSEENEFAPGWSTQATLRLWAAACEAAANLVDVLAVCVPWGSAAAKLVADGTDLASACAAAGAPSVCVSAAALNVPAHVFAPVCRAAAADCSPG